MAHCNKTFVINVKKSCEFNKIGENIHRILEHGQKNEILNQTNWPVFCKIGQHSSVLLNYLKAYFWVLVLQIVQNFLVNLLCHSTSANKHDL